MNQNKIVIAILVSDIDDPLRRHIDSKHPDTEQQCYKICKTKTRKIDKSIILIVVLQHYIKN